MMIFIYSQARCEYCGMNFYANNVFFLVGGGGGGGGWLLVYLYGKSILFVSVTGNLNLSPRTGLTSVTLNMKF